MAGGVFGAGLIELREEWRQIGSAELPAEVVGDPRVAGMEAEDAGLGGLEAGAGAVSPCLSGEVGEVDVDLIGPTVVDVHTYHEAVDYRPSKRAMKPCPR